MLDLTTAGPWLSLLLFSFGVFVMMFVLRKVLEGVIKPLAANWYWREIALDVLPVFMGMVGAIWYPFPPSVSNWFMRLVLGACGGFLSSKSYRIVTVVIGKVTGVDDTEAAKKA